MTIYLPEGVGLFRQAFDATCERISGIEKDRIFYELYLELVSCLREHTLVKDFILELEAQSAKRKEESSVAALEALEDGWMRLWKYHRHSLKHRKQLVLIKRVVTAPNEISYSQIYNRILFRMWEFRYFSPFCRFVKEAPRLFRTVQSELNLESIRFDYAYPSREGYFSGKKIVQCKLNKKDKRRKLHKKIFSLRLMDAMPFNRSAERVAYALFSQKIEAIEKTFFIPGQNDYEKRQNMQIMAETNPIFCWDKIQFLKICHALDNASPDLKSFKGRWFSIREAAWKCAEKRCEIEVLLGAKMSFRQKLAPEPSSSLDSLLMFEHQIHRRDYEKHLQSLKNHIHAHLFKVENMKEKAEEDLRLVLPGTQRSSFVIDLASKYWKVHPLANRDEVFNDYCIKCPTSRLLSRERWDQIVRERKLDPRPKEAKKRGPGKKTFQN